MPITFKEINYVYSSDMPYAYQALKDINLEIATGKITAIIGETGSGKSTMVQHLNALLLPSSGTLDIAGYHIVANEKTKGLKQLRRKVGLVFQFSEYQLFEETVIKDVAFGPKNFGDDEHLAMQKAAAALKMVGIDQSFFERSPLDLSGGQKRRVAIAGILAMEPEIIVLDEPTAGLDPKGANEMITLFNALNKKFHKTVILVTHDNEVVYNYADDVVLLAHGEVVLHTSVKELFDDYDLLDQYHLIKPQVVELKAMLNARGFKLSHDIRDIPSLVKALAGGKKWIN